MVKHPFGSMRVQTQVKPSEAWHGHSRRFLILVQLANWMHLMVEPCNCLLGRLSPIAYPETFSTPVLPNVTCQDGMNETKLPL